MIRPFIMPRAEVAADSANVCGGQGAKETVHSGFNILQVIVGRKSLLGMLCILSEVEGNWGRRRFALSKKQHVQKCLVWLEHTLICTSSMFAASQGNILTNTIPNTLTMGEDGEALKSDTPRAVWERRYFPKCLCSGVSKTAGPQQGPCGMGEFSALPPIDERQVECQAAMSENMKYCIPLPQRPWHHSCA